MPECFKFGRTQSERTFPEIPWDRRQSFLRRHDNDRDGEQRQGQRRPQDAARAEGGIRERLGKQPVVDRAPQRIDKKGEAEHPEDNGRHTGQVVHRNPHQPDQQALIRILPAKVIRKTINTVPKIAGKIPPSVFASRGSVETNSHRLRA